MKVDSSPFRAQSDPFILHGKQAPNERGLSKLFLPRAAGLGPRDSRGLMKGPVRSPGSWSWGGRRARDWGAKFWGAIGARQGSQGHARPPRPAVLPPSPPGREESAATSCHLLGAFRH